MNIEKLSSENETSNGILSAVSSSGFVSGCCKGEKCNVCGKDATNKLAEVIFDDDPLPYRHELTPYVCKEHFKMIVGNLG